MIWLDYTLLVIIALSAVYSIFRGFIREMLSLIGWVLAFWVAIKFSAALASYLEPMISVPGIRFGAAFLLLFLSIIVGTVFVNRLIYGLIKLGGLRGFDRLIGAGFGLARGVLIVAVLVFLGGWSPLAQEPIWQESIMVGYLQKFTTWVSASIPEGMLSGLQAQMLM